MTNSPSDRDPEDRACVIYYSTLLLKFSFTPGGQAPRAACGLYIYLVWTSGLVRRRGGRSYSCSCLFTLPRVSGIRPAVSVSVNSSTNQSMVLRWAREKRSSRFHSELESRESSVAHIYPWRWCSPYLHKKLTTHGEKVTDNSGLLPLLNTLYLYYFSKVSTCAIIRTHPFFLHVK